MVVVAVVAIFSTLAAPSFRKLIAQQRVKTASAALSESLWLARSEALKRNDDVSFTFTDASTGWDVTNSAAAVLHHQDGFASVSSQIRSGTGVFTFNPYGRLSGGSGQIEFSNGSAGVTRCVTVSTSGKATMKDMAC